MVLLSLLGLGIVLGGQDALKSLGIPATGLWVRLGQLAGLFLLVAALFSLTYAWKWPSRRQQAGVIKIKTGEISSADEAQINIARQMVQFPAIGLIVLARCHLRWEFSWR